MHSGSPPAASQALVAPASLLSAGSMLLPRNRASLPQTFRVSLPAGPKPEQSHPCEMGSIPCERAPGWFGSCTFTGVDPNHPSHSAISPLFPASTKPFPFLGLFYGFLELLVLT